MITKKNQERYLFRYFEIPKGSYVLPLLEDAWRRDQAELTDEMHFHNYLEIGYCYKGNGEMQLGNGTIPFFPGIFTVIPSNYPHRTIFDSDSVHFWEYLFIDTEAFIRSVYPDNNRAGEDLIRRINTDGLLLTFENHPRIGNLIQEIIREYREKKEYYLEAVKGYLLALLFEIARIQEKESSMIHFLHEEDFMQIGSALAYVNDNYHEQIRVRDLAAKCNLSEPHFRRLFEKKMNMTPVEYITRIRIHAACMLMQDSTLTIEEVAGRTGFISMSTFNRNFRKLMEVSPKQWRMEAERSGSDERG